MAPAKWLLSLGALAALPALADDIGPAKLADLSARLYAEGQASGDALTLATAARLRKEAGIDGPQPLGWQEMLTKAEALAAGDPALLAVIGDIRDGATRGMASGPIHQLAALAPGASEERPPMAFRGGEYAEAYVEAASGADINLIVLDAAGNTICADTDRSHVAYCGWTPAADGDFILVIQNAGDDPADYALLTN